MPDIYSKFSKHLKRSLNFAQKLASDLNNSEIGPNHLLIALFHERGGIACELLNKAGLNPEKIRLLVELTKAEKTTEQTNPSPELSTSSQEILARAAKLSFEFQHRYIGTEHLLLSIVLTPNRTLELFFQETQIIITDLENQLNSILKNTSRFTNLTSAFGGGSVGLEKVTTTTPGLNLKESALESFSVNLTSPEIQEKIDPIIGRELEIERLIQIISRRTKNNPVLLGDPGVGKTAIVEGLAKRIYEGKVPEVLINKKILTLDLGATVAGTMYRGDFENRLKQIIDEVKRNPDIILFIDELHTLVGAGSSQGSLDASNMLKPELARGNLRLIGATTLNEYKKFIESDPAFERRFQPIDIKEPDIEDTKKILRGIKSNYEKFHQVLITDEAIDTAVRLTGRFCPEKFFPDKAIDVIDEAAAKIKVAMTKHGFAKIIKKLEGELATIEDQKRLSIQSENYSGALSLRKQEEDLLTKLTDLKNQQTIANQQILGTVTSSDIAQIVSRVAKIPVTDLVKEEKDRLLNLETELNKKIIGQKEAISALANSIRRSKTGLANPNRPIASFIFLGPSGVGKTETAKQLAQILYSNDSALIRIDMTEFAEGFNTSKLIGSPAGYVGYKDQNQLTDSVRRTPYSIILLDEIEKAHPEIFNLFLPVLEDGQLTDASGRTVNFKNTIIIMTSNLGLSEFNALAKIGFDEKADEIKSGPNFAELKEKIEGSLKDCFRPEFLNRLDNIIVFNPLTEKDLEKIAKLNLEELQQRLQPQGIDLNIEPEVYEYLAKNSQLTDSGARAVRRIISEKIENPLAEVLLKSSKTNKIKIFVKANQIVIK